LKENCDIALTKKKKNKTKTNLLNLHTVYARVFNRVPRNRRVPGVAARGSTRRHPICLRRNSQPQFFVFVVIETHESLHTVQEAMQTFAQGFAAAK